MLENCYIEFFNELYYEEFFKEGFFYHSIMKGEQEQNEQTIVKIPLNLN